MRIGIDFGTTRTVVAAVDRGNYPLVHFETPDGQMRDWFPSIAAIRGRDRLYGWEAVALHDQQDWTVMRSLKRLLRTAGPQTELYLDGKEIPLFTILTEMMSALRKQLLGHSNLGAEPDDDLEAMVGVPANANSNQRFLTEEAAQAAGFHVLGVVNEPSAAAIEFAYRNSAERKGKSPSSLMVYDLGGGTFDASLLTLGDREHVVEASDGLPDAGGDDFDQILADLVLASASPKPALRPFEHRLLLDECREKKESLNPNTRKLTIDLERVRAGLEMVTIPVETYYEGCRGLIESTRAVVEKMLAANSAAQIDTLYVTGGGSELPAVARILRESFGRKVRRSAYMRSATAVGLAISAAAGPDRVRDRFNQNFGIWREADCGATIVFDLILPRGVRLPSPDEPPIRFERVYQPAHNIGHFRYLECSRLNENGQPVGEITNRAQIQFPFDPTLWGRSDLDSVPVKPLANRNGFLVREEYLCDASGNLRVKISESPTGNTCEFALGQMASH